MESKSIGHFTTPRTSPACSLQRVAMGPLALLLARHAAAREVWYGTPRSGCDGVVRTPADLGPAESSHDVRLGGLLISTVCLLDCGLQG